MKLHNIIIPVAAATVLLTACDEQKMEWYTPDGHGPVTASELPIGVKEVLANYSDIKAYAAEQMPSSIIGLGVGKDIYMGDEARQALANSNFQMITWGNAMKHDAVVLNNGSLDFAKSSEKVCTLDEALDAVKANGLQLYGHNFFWHTQQNQTYLKSVIAPVVEIVTDAADNVVNIVPNSDFENGTTKGWGAWSSAGCKQQISEQGDGYQSDYALHLYNPAAGANYSAQAYYKLDAPASTAGYEVGAFYILSFYVKADHVDTQFQMELQNRNNYSSKKYLGSPIEQAGKWYYYEHEIEMTEAIINSDFDHITIDFGAEVGNIWVDNIKFGAKKEGPLNYCNNGSFEDGTEGWAINNSSDGVEVVELADAVDGSKVLKMTAGASASKAWDLEVQSPNMPTLPGKKVRMSFWIKSDQIGKGRVAFNGLTNNYPYMPWLNPEGEWTEAFETSTNWQQVDLVIFDYNHNNFADGADTWSMKFDFGYVPGVTYYLDNVQVTEEEDKPASARTRAPRKATHMVYTFKTPEEKDALLTDAMESWVKGMADHLAEKGIVPAGYDVINEAIADGSNKVRGVDGIFGMAGDGEPVEDSKSGLELNWESGHFYWGYYVKDFGLKAFQFARKYLPTETKLFINDYNLEKSPGKLEALINWVKSIDAANGTPIVDGIGTQMHVDINPSDDAEKNAQLVAELKEKVDAQFQTMAATGKLVRVTELDVDMCSYDANGKRQATSSPSNAQYKCQADVYRMVFESYKANVPTNQQSGITIWSLTDQADEHEYWLKDGKPCLFDKDNLRKWAFKGVCDGIAGEDLGLKYGGEDYKAYYEKYNVSNTVK